MYTLGWQLGAGGSLRLDRKDQKMNRTKCEAGASAQLYLFCALHPKGICHWILIASAFRTLQPQVLRTPSNIGSFGNWVRTLPRFALLEGFTLEAHFQFHKCLSSQRDESTKLILSKHQEAGQLLSVCLLSPTCYSSASAGHPACCLWGSTAFSFFFR